MVLKNSSSKSKGHLCWLCGSEDKLTLHHLKSSPRPKKRRDELGLILYKGECIPLCRTCHGKIEFLKQKRDTLKGLASGISKAKKSISALVKDEFYFINGEGGNDENGI